MGSAVIYPNVPAFPAVLLSSSALRILHHLMVVHTPDFSLMEDKKLLWGETPSH